MLFWAKGSRARELARPSPRRAAAVSQSSMLASCWLAMDRSAPSMPCVARTQAGRHAQLDSTRSRVRSSPFADPEQPCRAVTCMRSPLAHKACAAGRTRRRGDSSRRLAAGLTAVPPIQLRVKNIDQNDHASTVRRTLSMARRPWLATDYGSSRVQRSGCTCS